MGHNHAVDSAPDEPQIQGLEPGAKLLRGQYEILRFLSNGGFGITYLARDSLDRDVVIKECYPGALCRRAGGLVEPADPAHKDDLRAIIDLFIQEARNHARLVHPNIVDVHQVFEDNNTAYIAMDLIRGCDLLDYIDDAENESGPEFIVQVTEKMLSAVSFIHQSGMLHRDISPDNILIDENGEPVLIDFGAAREQAANKSAALLTLRVIKDGYSPHEFYVRGADQGPSSDLYVLAATLYHAISGERPIDGQTRLNAFNNSQPDPYEPLAGRYEGYPDGFLEAIDKAMEVHATDRLQTALDWLRMFRGPGVMFDTFAYRPVSVIVGMDRKDEEAEKERIRAESENAEAVVTALLAGNTDLVLGNEEKPENEPAQFASQEDATVAVDTVVKSGSGGKGKTVFVTLILLAALAAGGYVAMTGDKDFSKLIPTITQDSAAAEAAPEPVEQTTATEAEPQPAAPEQVTGSEVTQAAPVEQAPEIAAPVPAETAADVAETAEAPLSAEVEAVADTPAEDILAAEPLPAEPVAEDATGDAPVAETVQPETEAVAIAPADPVRLVPNQVAYGHWDIDMPFTLSKRRASTGDVLAISRVDTDMDLAVIGDWVQRGATIFTLNGEPVRGDLSFEAQVLNDFTLDPDGYIRVAARYRALGQTRPENGLLALPALHVFGLENGVTFETRHTGDGGWQTVVASVPQENPGDLQRGDIVISETQTGTSMDAPESFEAALAQLVTDNQPQAQLSVLRDGAETAAIMQLTQEQ